MIPSAEETLRKTQANIDRQKEMEKAIKYHVAKIQNAQDLGLRYTTFTLPPWINLDFNTHEYEIKNLFLLKGYRFEHSGYLNGVWQTTELICW